MSRRKISIAFTLFIALLLPKTEAGSILVHLCNRQDEKRFSGFLRLLGEYGDVVNVYTEESIRDLKKSPDVKEDTPADNDAVVILCDVLGSGAGNTYADIVRIASEKALILAPVATKSFKPDPVRSITSFLSSLDMSPYIGMGTPAVYDVFSHRDSTSVVLVNSENGLNKVLFSDELRMGSAPIVYAGPGHYIKSSNRQLFPILSGNDSTYMNYKGHENYSGVGGLIGREIALVSGLQSINGSRSIISYSGEVFSDKFSSNSGNALFSKELLNWVFQKKHALRVNNMTHSLEKGLGSTDAYSPNDIIRVTVSISAFSDNEWGPFHGDDVQIELRAVERMSIINLTKIPKVSETLYTGTLRLPKHHGTYTLRLKYQRTGFTYLNKSVKVFVKFNEAPPVSILTPTSAFYYLVFAANCVSVPIFILSLANRKKRAD